MGTILFIIFLFSLLGLFFAFYLARWVLSKEMGNEKMNYVYSAIKEGAEAFLKRQNKPYCSYRHIKRRI